MEGVDHNKYVTFKRADLYEMLGKLALPPYTGQTSTGRVERAGAHWDCAPIAEEIHQAVVATELHDAVVIRRQDVFAAPALDAYANAMQCVIEVLRKQYKDIVPQEVKALMDVADYFHEQATKSYDTPDRKMPD